MDTTDPMAANLPKPTADRPLLGLTVLVIEDSRFASDVMRLVCLRSGARIRRADCLRSARRHLRVYRPSVVVIDLGLPDGQGTDLIEELNETSPRVETILAVSGEPESEAAALAAGADGFMAKPIPSIATFQEKILQLLPEDRRPKGPRELDDSALMADHLAYRDDMAHIADLLDEGASDRVLGYAAQFISGVALQAEDHPLAEAAAALRGKLAGGEAVGSETAQIAGLIQSRLAEKIAI